MKHGRSERSLHTIGIGTIVLPDRKCRILRRFVRDESRAFRAASPVILHVEAHDGPDFREKALAGVLVGIHKPIGSLAGDCSPRGPLWSIRNGHYPRESCFLPSSRGYILH